MIERHNTIKIASPLDKLDLSNSLEFEGNNEVFREAIFFDLEHYVYKKPVCIGVFGAAYFENNENELKVQQYMIENKEDSRQILLLSKDYFEMMLKKYNKKYIMTFSGNNDFTVINYLFQKYKIDFDFDNFKKVDLQKEYEHVKGSGIGLKALEKEFGIERKSELISGANLAKTFAKMVKDDLYHERMPEEKKNKILLYNEQDVVNLFYIYINWKKLGTEDNVCQ